MAFKFSLIPLAAIMLAPRATMAEPSCNKYIQACGKPGMEDVCKQAVQRWEADGIYDMNGPNTIMRGAKSGSLTCVAELMCDSSGGSHRFIGSDLRNT
jgi:hypothetical protein